MKGLKKRVCKVLSVVLSVMMIVSAFSGFATTSVSAAIVEDQSGNFLYTDLEDGTIEISKCFIDGDVDVPSYIDGKKVTSIGEYSFNDGVTSVSIPETVVTIQDNAFYDCYSLKKVKFSEGLKYIGEHAFTFCDIEELSFPETLEEIGDEAFSSYICELNFPKTRGVKIGRGAIPRGAWYYSQEDGPIISGKTFLCYKSYGTYVEEYTIPYGIESIGNNAFSDLYSLEKIDIPDTVKYISSGAFSNTNIKEIVIPDGVEEINDNLFEYCWSLSKVTIPDSVTYIGDYAFKYCENLAGGFVIPENVAYIGNFAFEDTKISDFTISKNNRLTYVGYEAFYYTPWYESQPDGTIYIEDIFVGVKTGDEASIIESVDIKDGTKIIAGGALRDFQGSITVPDTVKYINSYAFCNTKVGNDVISENVIEIGDGAFYGCSNLTAVVESDNLISVGDNAFESTNIVTFPIGSNLKNFGIEVFKDNKNLEAFTVKSDNKYFSAKNGILYNKDQTVMVCYPTAKKDSTLVITKELLDYKSAFDNGNDYLTEIVVEEGVTNIPSAVFGALFNVKEITIPTTVDKIGEQIFGYDSNIALTTVNYNAIDGKSQCAFMSYENLTTVNFGTEVISVYESTFSGCSNLANLNFGGNIEFIGEDAFINTAWDENIRNNFEGEYFYVDKVLYCSSNASGDITIKDGTKSIYCGAFSYNTDITSVTLPESLKSIANKAFYECRNLKTVNLPSSIEYIGDAAFSNCYALNEIELGTNLTYLGNSAFSNCSSLESIEIPSSLEVVGYSAFSYCLGLKEIVLNNGIKCIDGYAFEYTENLVSVKLPSTVESICNRAFQSSGIESIELNEGLECIGDSAFSNCYNLENISFPSTLERIDSYAFDGCLSLKSIVIPSTVNSIEYGAFYCCSSLKNVTIKNGVKNIGPYSFYCCEALQSIEIPSSVKKIENDAFYDCFNLQNIILNEGLEEIESHAFYRTSVESIVIPSTATYIGYGAFNNCRSLKNVTLNEGLERIDGYAFNNTVIESIVIPSTVKNIEYCAFGYCQSLKTVSLNEGIEYIGAYAFSDTAIESIVIPSTVKCIEQNTFDCTPISSVTLKEGLESIEYYAFGGCSNLKELLIPASVSYIDESAFDKDMTIHGYTGSYAQNYVVNHQYDESLTHTFVEIERMIGDINGDGTVNVTDVTELQKHLAGMTELTQKGLACCDVTGNSKIDIKDASHIAKALAGFCEL